LSIEINVDIHTHSYVSDCGWNTHLELAEAALLLGLEGVAITDHGSSQPGKIRRNFLLRFDGSWKGIRVLKGIEANILEKGTDAPGWLMSYFDIILAGLHKGGPCLDVEKNTALVLDAFRRCSYVDVLTHPFIRGFPLDLRPVVKEAADRGICMEVNNSVLALKRCDPEAPERMLSLCREYSCRIAVGSDAHSVSEVGRFSEAINLLEAPDFPTDLIINRNLETTLRFLQERKPHKLSKS
jgi:putative hydrolase